MSVGLPAPGTWRSSISSGGGRIPTGFLSSCFSGRWARLSILPWRRFPTLDCWASPSKCFRGASALRELEAAIHDNPSAGNYEELGDLYMDDGKLADGAGRVRQSHCRPRRYARSLLPARSLRHPVRRRGSRVARPGTRGRAKSPTTISSAPLALLAHAYAQTGQKEKAEALFRQVTVTSTLSETYLNFAELLASEGRNAEAREWAQKVLDKKPTMPGYLRRRERPWFRRANEMLKRVPA